MLVLQRFEDEEIIIGTAPNQITIKVIDIRSDRIKLGIDAPKGVPILRKELVERNPEEL